MHLTPLSILNANQNTPINKYNSSYASSSLERSPKTDSVSFCAKPNLPKEVLGNLPKNFGVVIEGLEGLKGKLYRGAKPVDEKQIAALNKTQDVGITFILDLHGSDTKEPERAAAHGIGYKFIKADDYNNIPIAVKEIQKRLANGENVYVHCSEGKDRTGNIVAVLQRLMGVADTKIEDEYTDHFGNISKLDDLMESMRIKRFI